jgi:signal peptidase II
MPLVAGGIIALDQLTKWWATRALDDGHRIHLVWTLRLNLVRNSGAAFSTGRGLGPLLGVLAVGIVLVLVRLGRIYQSPAMAVALGGVLGGAIGNLLDRLLRDGSGGFLGGHVVDFIDVQWWPVWNVADMAIVGGAIGLAWFSTRLDDRPGPAPGAPAPPDAASRDDRADAAADVVRDPDLESADLESADRPDHGASA